MHNHPSGDGANHIESTGTPWQRRPLAIFASGCVIGLLGGLIGLGGAEFRLPLLLAVFGFAALEAVILNKTMSLIVVVAALLFRGTFIPFEAVWSNVSIVLTLLGGSLVGAWFGADLAARLSARTLYRTIAILLVIIALVLVVAHDHGTGHQALSAGTSRTVLGVGAGFIIGAVASLLGVAGGELLIPTLILLFGVDVKLAGSLSLVISLPTMLVGFARYSRDRAFSVLRTHFRFALIMAAGSILGALLGGLLLGIVPNGVLLPLLAAILLISAAKMWRHH